MWLSTKKCTSYWAWSCQCIRFWPVITTSVCNSDICIFLASHLSLYYTVRNALQHQNHIYLFQHQNYLTSTNLIPRPKVIGNKHVGSKHWCYCITQCTRWRIRIFHGICIGMRVIVFTQWIQSTFRSLKNCFKPQIITYNVRPGYLHPPPSCWKPLPQSDSATEFLMNVSAFIYNVMVWSSFRLDIQGV